MICQKRLTLHVSLLVAGLCLVSYFNHNFSTEWPNSLEEADIKPVLRLKSQPIGKESLSRGVSQQSDSNGSLFYGKPLGPSKPPQGVQIHSNQPFQETLSFNQNSSIREDTLYQSIRQDRLDYVEIGCFSAMTVFYQNIGNMATSLEACRLKCLKNNLYYIFSPSNSRCVCRDQYHPMYSKPPSHCAKNNSGSIVGVSGNTTGLLVSKYLSNSARNCRCTSNSCESITCNNIGSDRSCWAGPKKTDLLKYQKENSSYDCHDEEYTIYSMQPKKLKRGTRVCTKKECIYCVKPKDMYGFWPVEDCSKFHPPKTPLNKIRLYKITPPGIFSIPTQVTVFTKKRVKDTAKILLLGYYRSGSTFSSELFRSHPDAFYLFEPFHSIVPRNISSQHEEVHDYLVNQTSIAMSSIFECNFLEVPFNTISRFPQADKMLKSCQAKNILDCVAMFIARCQAQRLTVVKSIRARMLSVERMMNNNKHTDLKVTLLLRDPRGMMRSRINTAGSPDKKYANNSSEIFRHAAMLCMAMADDIQRAKQMQKIHSQQVVIIHYEDIANYTKTAANYIYRVLGLSEPPQEIKSAISALEGNNMEKAFGVFRRDSVATAYKWKKSLSFKQVKLIDEGCKDYYKYIGYEPVGSEQELSDPNNYHRTHLTPLI
ncbi:hypothetical protein EB796_018430 [Bugula neritina]|uniref:Sulfotransferase domain-containing protein n=1 Tax=Bugula neritina TaxID=10212 RepID=A0A7J7JBD0_BUGNE|nr:hypothetical protein EB796_018430 [Bugula neritina]